MTDSLTRAPLPPSRVVLDPDAWTPVENRAGRLYKRDDLHTGPAGVNGGKWRQCQWLVRRLREDGSPGVVSGASVLSPQLAMTAAAAALEGLPCTLYVGTDPTSALRHPSPRAAVNLGAVLRRVAVGYNPALQAAVRAHAADTGDGILHYGVAPDPAADLETVRAFHDLGARQAHALCEDHPGLADVVVPFGSGNSGASILWGIAQAPRADRPQRIHLVGIGPNRLGWLWGRLTLLGLTAAALDDTAARVRHYDLHGRGEVTYGQRVRYTADGITLHPTYEGKVAAWLDRTGAVPGWETRDSSMAFWIVGAPVAP